MGFLGLGPNPADKSSANTSLPYHSSVKFRGVQIDVHVARQVWAVFYLNGRGGFLVPKSDRAFWTTSDLTIIGWPNTVIRAVNAGEGLTLQQAAQFIASM